MTRGQPESRLLRCASQDDHGGAGDRHHEVAFAEGSFERAGNRVGRDGRRLDVIERERLFTSHRDRPGDLIWDEQLVSSGDECGREGGVIGCGSRYHIKGPHTRAGHGQRATRDTLIGYGYRTWQAGLWLLGFWVAAWIVFARAYPGHLTPARPGEPQPAFHSLIYALDTLLPVVNLHQEDNWIPRGGAQSWAWSFILVGWVLTTAAAAAFTGVLKRD